MLRSINPFDQSIIGEFPLDNAGAVEQKLESASSAFQLWRKTSFTERAGLLKKVAIHLRSNQDKLASIITQEMGKVFSEAVGEISKCADVCDFFAEHAEEFLKDQRIVTEASKSFVTFQPLGPVLAIMPWNFPFWQVFRFAAPTLMAGNVGVLKHASNVTQCALAIQSAFKEAGFPVGVFQVVLVQSDVVSKIIDNDRITAVALTGSEYAGTQVASQAGKNLKKTVLELGGSDPFIVLDDADLDLAAKIGTQSRMRNAGQSCIAAKRFIIMKSVKDEFLEKFKRNVEALQQGNPFDKNVSVGPLARLDLAKSLENQVQESIKSGAQLITGSTRRDANFIPTILDHVKPGMIAFEEEMFGPVASVIAVQTEDEAIKLANASRYGLGASVWTKDPQRGEFIARQIESGSVFVNSLMRSDQRLPFGGIKKSGYGRELSELGIKEFVNAKTVYVN